MKIAQVRDELKESLEHLESFNDASKGYKSNCGIFDKLPYDERKMITRFISIYLETWVLPRLRSASKELNK